MIKMISIVLAALFLGGCAVYADPYAYAPPPPVAGVYVAPPPTQVVVAPPPACRSYQTTVVVDGVPHQVAGTACRQPDGSWRVVR